MSVHFSLLRHQPSDDEAAPSGADIRALRTQLLGQSIRAMQDAMARDVGNDATLPLQSSKRVLRRKFGLLKEQRRRLRLRIHRMHSMRRQLRHKRRCRGNRLWLSV